VTARLTCSIIAPHNHQLQVIGDDGVIGIDSCWHYRAPVQVRRWLRIRRKVLLTPWRRKLKLVDGGGELPSYRAASEMDWLRGISEMADAITEARPHRLSPEFVYHNCEVALAIDAALAEPGHKVINSRFDPIEPMPWALD
jgi:hypothetical protein